MATMVRERTFGMQVLQEQTVGGNMLRVGRQPEATRLERFVRSASHFLLKLLLVTMVSLGFLYTASFILATTNGVLFKAMTLTIWSCGFVPVSCYLWNS